MPILVQMPKWGLTMKAGTVTEWLVDEGAEVSAGQPLLVVETDKISSDVEAPADGVLRKIVAQVGAEIPILHAVALLAAPGETLSDEEVDALVEAARQREQRAGAEKAAGARVAREARAATRREDGRITASPAARKLAIALGIDLATVQASGPGGRITSEDVERAAAQETETREDYLSLQDGRLLFYVLAGPPAGRPPLVLLHGLGGSQSTWQMLLPSLAESHRVCALDLPGHGQSDRSAPPAGDYSVAGLARAVMGALEALSLDGVVLIGHSLGGAVAMQVALERPEIVKGLVLVDSAGLGEEINPDLLDRVNAEPSREEARLLLELFFRDQRYVLESGVEDLYQQQIAPGAMEAVRAAAAASFSPQGQRLDLRARLGQLKPQVLIVWGAEDRVIPARHASLAATAVPGARSVVLEQAGHVPQIEAAEAVAQAIKEFLQTVPK